MKVLSDGTLTQVKGAAIGMPRVAVVAKGAWLLHPEREQQWTSNINQQPRMLGLIL
jgi:hypothetical protein